MNIVIGDISNIDIDIRIDPHLNIRIHINVDMINMSDDRINIDMDIDPNLNLNVRINE